MTYVVTETSAAQLRSFGKTIPEQYEQHRREHPEFYDLIVKLARDIKARGYDHYGIKALFEVARYHYQIERGEGEWKINNNLTAYYAREIMAREPDLRGFFETRELRSQ